MSTDSIINSSLSSSVSIGAPSVATSPLSLPAPRVALAIRPAMLDDIAFMDELQSVHVKQVGWMPTQQLEAKVGLGQVVVAEAEGSPVAYCISSDRYMKREDVGIVYQMNVAPGHQRGFIGAALLKYVFEHAAYGCRLFCCWCAQDLQGANRFWEAMGFVPLAFRAGSAKRSRVHIFWQRRVREGDVTTPWWYPSRTDSGSIREDRLVLPVPPGVHWSEVRGAVLPGTEMPDNQAPQLKPATAQRSISSGKASKNKEASKLKGQAPKGASRGRTLSGWRFAPLLPAAPAAAAAVAPEAIIEAGGLPKRSPARKNDPKLVAAARELRDRWLEEVNAGRYLPVGRGKYEVGTLSPDLAGEGRARGGAVALLPPLPLELPTAA